MAEVRAALRLSGRSVRRQGWRFSVLGGDVGGDVGLDIG